MVWGAPDHDSARRSSGLTGPNRHTRHFELRNEVTVTFPREGIFQNFFNFKLPHTHSITPAKWHNINLAGYRAVAPTQNQLKLVFYSSVPPNVQVQTHRGR